jgi:hypothetical protein
MSDVEAVHDILGGKVAEVESAISELCDPANGGDGQPMIRIDANDDGSRTLTVVAWSEWNTPDVTAAKRAKNHRERKRNGAVTRDATEPSHQPSRQRYGHRGEEKREEREEKRGDAPSAPRPLVGSLKVALADEWADAVRSETGKPFALSRFDRDDLADAVGQHWGSRPDKVATVRGAAVAFVRAVAAGGGVAVVKGSTFRDWLNAEAPPVWPKPRHGPPKQEPAKVGQHDWRNEKQETEPVEVPF